MTKSATVRTFREPKKMSSLPSKVFLEEMGLEAFLEGGEGV